MSESFLKARARSNPHFLGYRHFVMATRVAFTHTEALFPGVPAGDSLLFNVPANIEIFTGVPCFTDVSLFILRSRSRPPRQPKFVVSLKSWTWSPLNWTRCVWTYSQHLCCLTSEYQFPFGIYTGWADVLVYLGHSRFWSSCLDGFQ